MVKIKNIHLRTSPHIKGPGTVTEIMWNVVFAILPMVAYMIWMFGLSALIMTITSVLSCLITERVFARDRASFQGDGSAVITGLLLSMTLPPSMPLWMIAVAGAVSIGLGKVIFGGIGFNVFNPALVGRAFVQAAFPVAVNTWPPAFFEGRFTSFIPSTFTPPMLSAPSLLDWGTEVAIDAYSGATPLALQKFQGEAVDLWDLFIGAKVGFVTGAPAALILVCGLYLAFRNMLDWRIPASVLGSAALLSGVFYLIDPAVYPSPLFVVFSGGLMLGAWFMATDMVGSPVTPWGVVIFGALIGVITVVIRLFGGMAEGVMYAILLANAATPLIEQYTQPTTFGARPKPKPEAKKGA